jgi:hypothetical protein
MVYGGFMLKFMAGRVVCAGFFDEEERTLAIERLNENHQGVGSRQFKWYQVREACLDLRVSLNCRIQINDSKLTDADMALRAVRPGLSDPAGGLTLISSVLIKSLGFNSKTTLLFAMPSGGLQLIFQLSVGFIVDKTRQCCLSDSHHFFICSIPPGWTWECRTTAPAQWPTSCLLHNDWKLVHHLLPLAVICIFQHTGNY